MIKSRLLFLFLILTALSGGYLFTFAQEVDTVEDIGRLPESFSMETDSLLNARYREYYSYSHYGNGKKKQPVGSDDLYKSRLRSMEEVIPLPYNSVVRDAIDMYVGGRGLLISKMLARSALYFPVIEEELDREGLPLELKYLAIVESALNPTATSRAGAVGLWQFMLRTAKIYGLHVDSMVDERMDPKKSTHAMAKYFKDLYSIYGDWLLTISAYNCGPGNVNKAIQRAGGGKYASFWDVYPYLPRETRSYVPFFIAAYYAMEHYREHSIRPSLVKLPLATDTVHIDTRLSFREISEVIDITEEELKDLNPSFKKMIIPGNNGTQVLRLPATLSPLFVAKLPTLTSDAEATYRETQADAAKVETKSKKEDKTKRKETSSGKRYYVVKRGDNLYKIARKYRGVSVNDIKRANGLKSNEIKPGKKLVIPR